MNLCLIGVSTGVIISAIKWPLKTALFPLVISISVLLMTTAELLMSLFGKEEGAKKGAAIDFKFSEDIDKTIVLRRTIGSHKTEQEDDGNHQISPDSC